MTIHVMYRKDIGFWNVDNEEDRDAAITDGARELSAEEIEKAGMLGNEQHVSPDNTFLASDGTITFSIPVVYVDDAKQQKINEINEEVSNAIVAGFEYQMSVKDGAKPESLHFSYDIYDQQNFTDVAVKMSINPEYAVQWNAYRGHTIENKGELVVLNLTAATFFPIYNEAVAHKEQLIAEGAARKNDVMLATTLEDIQRI